MTYLGHVKNGGVVLDQPVSLPGGVKVRVVPTFPDPGCFAALAAKPTFDRQFLDAMRGSLTQEQYDAFLAVAAEGGPDIEVISRFRAASMT